ncbi:MAG: hypothetical protein JWR05_2543 [Mucilaginibacter sp.]|nr:hypothetical protein [Mucilaginibacter sp.]
MTPILNFFIDKKHYPYEFEDNLSFNNKKLLELLGPDAWLCWTLRTYLELKDYYTCYLTDTIPESGITFFFRGSINFTQKPNKAQFWICSVGDAFWHPYSHINLFQNNLAINIYPNSYFIRLWQQLHTIKFNPLNGPPKNIYYFGDEANLAVELKSQDWKDFIAKNDFVFKIPHSSEWNDYSNADFVIGIRPFNPKNKFLNKPASKLINSWRANVVFIGGHDTAFDHERQTEFDFVSVKNYLELKENLINLKNNRSLYTKYRLQSIECGKRYPDDFFVNQWFTLINEKIMPLYNQSINSTTYLHNKFLLTRFMIYKSEALVDRLKKLFMKLFNVK